ncbi:sulfotransferase family protein [Microbulbifer hydrolyticus]|uniref:Sulfotransferase n=1 Tax=Microbulbifer hydrolyticus TaxID=48074 RepID=A0A6P1TEZ6_9GAMM|nr:sulfotransferase [Microbulbifer hydrolyticus]MBB5211836.1 hypothetical protein [Microbulbifer hydrolyticus]QHQ40577.1 sulfotransferase [Microbulbifer hydrolyticus]
MPQTKKQVLPDFLIVGAMKSATTTIYEQLKSLDGIFMPALKEPNFFSDPKQFDRGMDWYQSLFLAAKESDIIGEASTHYTKLPTYGNTVDRIALHLPDIKIIYIMRDPIDRLVSQYIHEWTCKKINCSLDEAVEKHPELIQYSCYFYQIQPYIERFGMENVLPVFFERIKRDPENELERISRFIGYKGEVRWTESSTKTNISAERLRLSPLMSFIVNSKALSKIRRNLIPARIRGLVKSKYRMSERPKINEKSMQKISARINSDFKSLGELLGVRITSENYKSVVHNIGPGWDKKKKASREALFDGG